MSMLPTLRPAPTGQTTLDDLITTFPSYSENSGETHAQYSRRTQAWQAAFETFMRNNPSGAPQLMKPESNAQTATSTALSIPVVEPMPRKRIHAFTAKLKNIKLGRYDTSTLDAELAAFTASADDFKERFGTILRPLERCCNDYGHYASMIPGKKGDYDRKHHEWLGKCYAWPLDRLLEPYKNYDRLGYSVYGESDIFQRLEKNLQGMKANIDQFLKDEHITDETGLKNFRLRNFADRSVYFLDAYVAAVRALPEMRAHPFVALYVPQIKTLQAKIEQRNRDIERGHGDPWPKVASKAQPRRLNAPLLDLSTLDEEIATLNANAKDFRKKFGEQIETLGRQSRGYVHRTHGDISTDAFAEFHVLAELFPSQLYDAESSTNWHGYRKQLPNDIFERIRIQLTEMNPNFGEILQRYGVHDEESLARAQKYNHPYDLSLFETYRKFIPLLPAMEQHPFITESLPQIAMINAKLKQRHEMQEMEREAREAKLVAPRAEFLTQLLQEGGEQPTKSLGFTGR